MVRPRRFRRILNEPKISCFKPENDDLETSKPIKISIDEFEAIRLKDYHEINQKRSAELMDISQPTFHRTLKSARKKISRALVEGQPLTITGGDYITDKKRYKCLDCQFEWISPEKEYDKCPDCNSKNINKIDLEEEDVSASPLAQRRSYGGRGIGAGPPRICKCPECGYESSKTRGVPCKNTKCPECETPLCGAD
ncbi:DUF134 domain-containing protein [Methanobacterium alcaliphilum]|uniref:DUF134 domain-containing protein n=1 Tax=Methanobacterium alcaliphilum TaxID=392018 RepID=UPI00200AB559|nr:DUF134 domain-containing protein [Methanobacterium alcaliphilum]MCK9151558.1 DUF134 domain-containing protein [Methanobacterium alcaliphilum]